MGMVDQKIQAHPFLHSSQGALHASKVQSHNNYHASPLCCKIFHDMSEYKQGLLSFDANFSSFLLAESPPRDLQKK